MAKTTNKAIKADDKKERREILINGVVELIGWEGKIGKLQKKLQNAAKTVHTVSGAVGSIAKEPNVDGLIGAAVIIGKDAVSDTKVGRIADDVNKYGEKLNNELRQNETENKLSVSPVTNVADNRETAAPTETEENIVAAAETNMENITETTGRPETQTENTNTQTKPVLPETVAEEFKNNMISGHHRLQEVRAKIAARKKRYGRQFPNGGRRYCLDTEFTNQSCPADGYPPSAEFQCRKNDVAASDATLLV